MQSDRRMLSRFRMFLPRWLAVVFYSQRVGRAKSELREKLVWRRRFLFFQCLKVQEP